MKSSKSKALNNVFSVILSLLSLAYVFPIFMILINSLKKENSITTDGAFVLPTAETFDTCYISHAPFILTNNALSFLIKAM